MNGTPFSVRPPGLRIVILPDGGKDCEEWFDGAIQTYSDAKTIWPVWLITKFPLALPTELKGIAV